MKVKCINNKWNSKGNSVTEHLLKIGETYNVVSISNGFIELKEINTFKFNSSCFETINKTKNKMKKIIHKNLKSTIELNPSLHSLLMDLEGELKRIEAEQNISIALIMQKIES